MWALLTFQRPKYMWSGKLAIYKYTSSTAEQIGHINSSSTCKMVQKTVWVKSWTCENTSPWNLPVSYPIAPQRNILKSLVYQVWKIHNVMTYNFSMKRVSHFFTVLITSHQSIKQTLGLFKRSCFSQDLCIHHSHHPLCNFLLHWGHHPWWGVGRWNFPRSLDHPPKC